MEKPAAGPQQTTGVALGTMVGLPLVAYYLYFCVRFNDGALIPGTAADWPGFWSAIVPTLPATAFYLGWVVFQAALYVLLPGRLVEGLPLDDGPRLRYRLNGLAAFVLTLGLLGLGQASGRLSLGWIYDNFGALLSTMTIFTFGLALVLYAAGRQWSDGRANALAAFVEGYFLGTSLNPRIAWLRDFDLKFFFETRPGLIGWVVVDAGLAAAQVERHGALSTAMLLVLTLQAVYVASAFVFEGNLLSMIDIRTERFGWTLVYGDCVVVPMLYSLQAFYLVDHVPTLPVPIAVLVVVLFVTGLVIFRTANAQKDRFRRDPYNTQIWGKPAEFIPTQRGTPLLVSGLWGWSRHMNYFGDLLIASSWSLATLFGSVVPYFYPVWLGAILVNREGRDDRWCAQKYGADWDRYRRRVRYRIVPGVY